MATVGASSSYEELRAKHRWEVPERYNIARDVCFKHPADKLAMVYEDPAGIVHAHRYLLAHEEFVYCHEVQDGERFHGMGEWAWAAGIAPLIGPWRLGGVQVVLQREGGFDPHRQLDVLSRHEVTNVFGTPTA